MVVMAAGQFGKGGTRRRGDRAEKEVFDHEGVDVLKLQQRQVCALENLAADAASDDGNAVTAADAQWPIHDALPGGTNTSPPIGLRRSPREKADVSS
jgi:hypothetical protein